MWKKGDKEKGENPGEHPDSEKSRRSRHEIQSSKLMYGIPPVVSRPAIYGHLLGTAAHPAIEGGGEDQIHLIFKARNGMIVEDDFVVSPDIHLRGKVGTAVKIDPPVVFDLVIGVVYLDSLRSYQFREHTLTPSM